MNFLSKVMRGLLIFGYLMGPLLMRPADYTDVGWVTKGVFFFTTKEAELLLRMHLPQMTVLQAIVCSALAMFGYFRSFACNQYSRASLEQAMMDGVQKFSWVWFLPWMVNFSLKWLKNFQEIFLLVSGHEAGNTYSYMILPMAFFVLRSLLASEVFSMAFHDYRAMKKIEREQQKLMQRL